MKQHIKLCHTSFVLKPALIKRVNTGLSIDRLQNALEWLKWSKTLNFAGLVLKMIIVIGFTLLWFINEAV